MLDKITLELSVVFLNGAYGWLKSQRIITLDINFDTRIMKIDVSFTKVNNHALVYKFVSFY